MKIGIFLAYAPEQDIRAQGIGRLMGFIISGLLKEPDTEVVIALPAWYKKTLFEFLHDCSIDHTKIELITTPGIPYFIKIRNFIENFRNTRKGRLAKLFKKITSSCKSIFKRIFVRWMSISSTLLFVPISLVLLSIGVLLSPIVIAAYLIYHLVTHQFYFDHIKKIIKRLKLHRIFPLHLFSYLIQPTKFFRNNYKATSLFNSLREIEINRLGKIVNKHKDIKFWYIPCMFWPEIKVLTTKKIIGAHDIVFLDFPTLFTKPHFSVTMEHITQTLTTADHLVCLSDYVKQNHFVKPFGIPAAKISVIKHGAVDLSHYLTSKESQTAAALTILQDYQESALKDHTYLNSFDFSTTRFIFYSSQVRPHKNILTLMKAIEFLLRNRRINIKLILTGNAHHCKDIKKYYVKKRLTRDILFIPEIPSKVLAALNHLAICAINPSLFEGGFPFTFTEAYSVGTPSLMANIPMTSEEIADELLRQRMLFDPYNINDLIKKAEWAINNHETLYELQRPLYEQMLKRSWDAVSRDYIELFKSHAA